MTLLHSPATYGHLVFVALSCALAIEPPAAAQDRPAREPDPAILRKLQDPLADDWVTEQLHVHAKRQLERLSAALEAHAEGDLERSFADLFVGRIRIPPLRPPSEVVPLAGEMEIRRQSAVAPREDNRAVPAVQLRALIERFLGALDMRIEFTIVRIDEGDDGAFSSTVLYEASGKRTAGGTQENARWEIGWTRGADATRPLIREISVHEYRSAESKPERFVECTTLVLGDNEVWRDQLLRGGDHWYGKIDAVGELNYLGHQGIAVGDVNGDGLDDLYVAMGTGLPNLLYVQNMHGGARETAAEAGVAWLDDTKGVLLIDADNDGDQDLFCAIGPTVVLCENDGSGHFTPARRMRAASDAAFYSLAAADYDRDGDLDIYACRYVMQRYGLSIPMPFHDANNGPPNHLLRNDGEAGFTDVTHDVGLDVNNRRFSLAAGWADYDGDGDADLYVTNDFGGNNLYRNDGGKFVDVAAQAGVLDLAAGMGVSWSDFDLDGDLDLYVSNMSVAAGQRITEQARFKESATKTLRSDIRGHALGNSLYVNTADGSFVAAGAASGVRAGGWAWGALFADINNDGLDDIIVPNGFLTNERDDALSSFFWRHVAARSPVTDAEKRAYINGWVAMTEMMDGGASWHGKERNRCFVNLGDGTFADASAPSGLDFPDDGRAVALSDWDGDGDLDMWFRNRTGPQLRFMRNVEPDGHHFVAFKLLGKTCNRDAIGVVVEVRAGGRRYVRTVVAGDGYLSQSSKWLHFGLGNATRLERATVRWPGAAEQVLTALEIDKRYVVAQGGEPIAQRRAPVNRGSSPIVTARRSEQARVVLRVPLPLPPSLTAKLFEGDSGGRVKVVCLWKHEREACVAGLSEIARGMASLASADVDVVALSLDEPEDREGVSKTFEQQIQPQSDGPGLSAGMPTPDMVDAIEAVVHHVLSKPGEIVLPASLLVDRSGALQVLYLGRVATVQILADVATFGSGSAKGHLRSAFGGRWYYSMPRDLKSLARDLLKRGRRDDARHYVMLERLRRGGGNAP